MQRKIVLRSLTCGEVAAENTTAKNHRETDNHPRQRGTRVTDNDTETVIAEAADHFRRIFISMAAIEMRPVLRELDRPTLSKLGAAEWFLTSQVHRLTVRVMTSTRTKLVHPWGVSVRHAADAFNNLAHFTELGYRLMLSPVVAAGRAGEDVTRAYIEAIPNIEPAIHERATAVIRTYLEGEAPRE